MFFRLFQMLAMVPALLCSSLLAQSLNPDGALDFARNLPSAMLQVDSDVRLGSITAAELFSLAGGGAIDEGAWSRTGGFGFQNPNQVFRSIDRFWRYRTPTAPVGDPLSAIDVSYSVIGANGNLEVLSHTDVPAEEIFITLQPHPVVLVGSTAKQVILEGGVTLVLDLERARLAGQYTGILTVTVNQF